MTKLQNRTCAFVDRIPCGKILLFLLSVFVSEKLLFSPALTVFVVCGLLFHEFGHAWAANHKSIGVKGVYVFPWGNALCVYKGRRQLWKVYVFLTYMGPVFSAILCILLCIIGTQYHNDIFLAGACCNAGIAVTALIPINERDGKKMFQAVFKKGTGLSIAQKVEVSLVYVVTFGTSILVFAQSVRWSFFTDLNRFYAPAFVHFTKYIVQVLTGHGF